MRVKVVQVSKFLKKRKIFEQITVIYFVSVLDMQYQILSCARKHLSQGGPKRIGFTLPPIIVSAFQLSKQFYSIKETVSCTTNNLH